MNKAKKWFVALGIFISTLVACDNSYENELQAEKEKQQTEREAQTLYKNTIDSVLKSEGFYEKSQQSKRELFLLYSKRDSLRALPCRADVLDERIRKSAEPIIKQSIVDMVNALKPYNMDITSLHQIVKVAPYLTSYGVFESDTIYEVNYDEEVDFIVDIFLADLSYSDKYDEATKTKIRNAVRKHVKDLLAKLKRNRIAISKEYSAYYPVLDLSCVPQQYVQYFDYDPAVIYEDGDFYWYDRGELGNGIAVVKEISVYDSDLDPEFFNDSTARYELVQIAKGQWQVKKTLNSGKTEKTPVFSDSVEYKTFGTTQVQDGVKTGSSEFKAVKGTNIGVRIYFTQYVYVKRATKSDIISKNPSKDMKETNNLSRQIEEKSKKQEQIEHAIKTKADSIANVRAKQFRLARSNLH